MMPDVVTFAERADLMEAALAHLYDALAGTTGDFVTCLSGGRTPQPFYARLADEINAGRLEVGRIIWIVGDERAVPFDHPRSNFGMIRALLFAPAGIEDSRILPMPASAPDLAAAALIFERKLQSIYGAPAIEAGRPLFDFNLLGLGEDGHTASLFPGSDALDERDRWVIPTRAPDGEMRLSLTFPVLNASRHVVMFVEGVGKREALTRWRGGDAGIPAARLDPPGGVTVLADKAAAPA